MAGTRKTLPNPAALAAAEALGEPIRALVESRGMALADDLGIPTGVATAALADLLAMEVAPGLLKQIGRDAVSSAEIGKSAAYQAVAELAGTTRQGVSYRLRTTR